METLTLGLLCIGVVLFVISIHLSVIAAALTSIADNDSDVEIVDKTLVKAKVLILLGTLSFIAATISHT
ncbi:hypothetical protein [Schnuerera sp.]|uniref:hypothetical protein n=1 Tax=Schnuerera sp. TaxID=2794844 RepID=UPI002C0917E2|nr:hypothetical protein [Schnuerera sp.]HSH35233.1 hypothetical protein [Schnuerera sp.]